MIRLQMKFNGRTITSASQLEREMRKSVNDHVEKAVRRAAGSGVRLQKTATGYVAEGSADQIKRMQKRLS